LSLQVLHAVPFLNLAAQNVFDWVIAHGVLRQCTAGEVVWEPSKNNGFLIVIYGLVKSSFQTRSAEWKEIFLGSGGVVGLLNALVGKPLPGGQYNVFCFFCWMVWKGFYCLAFFFLLFTKYISFQCHFELNLNVRMLLLLSNNSGVGPIIAEANALHKGPVVFEMPGLAVEEMRRLAAAGNRQFMQLEQDALRFVGQQIVERLRGDLLGQMALQYTRTAMALVKRRSKKAAERQLMESVQESGLPTKAEVEAEEAPEVIGPGLSHKETVEQELLHELDEPGRAPLSDRNAEQLWPAAELAAAPDNDVLSSLDAHKIWHKARAFARHELAEIRQELRDAHLANYAPGTSFVQSSHLVLLHGSLASEQPVVACTMASSPGIEGPAVLPWTEPHFHRNRGRGAGKVFTVTGIGALLLVCAEADDIETESEVETPRANHGSGAGEVPGNF
jgi:hypothetical protein